MTIELHKLEVDVLPPRPNWWLDIFNLSVISYGKGTPISIIRAEILVDQATVGSQYIDQSGQPWGCVSFFDGKYRLLNANTYAKHFIMPTDLYQIGGVAGEGSTKTPRFVKL